MECFFGIYDICIARFTVFLQYCKGLLTWYFASVFDICLRVAVVWLSDWCFGYWRL